MEQKNSRKIVYKTHLFPKKGWLGIKKIRRLERVVTCRCFQLRPRILNLSCAKINLTFGAGHVTGYLYIFYTFENPLSLSHVLIPSLTALSRARTVSDISPRTTSDKQPKMGASKTTFITLMKLVYLPHSNFLNFIWTSKSLYTYRYTRLASEQMNTSRLFSRAYIHTHTYT